MFPAVRSWKVRSLTSFHALDVHWVFRCSFLPQDDFAWPMTGGLLQRPCWLGELIRGAGSPSPHPPRARRAVCGSVGQASPAPLPPSSSLVSRHWWETLAHSPNQHSRHSSPSSLPHHSRNLGAPPFLSMRSTASRGPICPRLRGSRGRRRDLGARKVRRRSSTRVSSVGGGKQRMRARRRTGSAQTWSCRCGLPAGLLRLHVGLLAWQVVLRCR